MMSNRFGFTLVEVAVVLVVLVLIASLGIPKLRGTLAHRQLQYSADQIRGEWLDTKIRAMEEGQIFCIRYKLGGSTMVIDRVLDAHFTAGLSSRQTTRRFDSTHALDPFEKGGFAGDYEDFILRDPESATTERGAVIVELPKTVILTDVIAVAEERAAYYLGMTMPGENEIEENMSEIEAVTFGEVRLGETAAADGKMWSTPIFFYPDGTTSTAAVLLKNESGRCCEVRLRGLTGTGTVTEATTTQAYTGELNTERY